MRRRDWPIFYGCYAMVFALLVSSGCKARAQLRGAANTDNLTPLIDLGTHTYQGFEGGLYPNGSNQPPDGYLQLGLATMRNVKPLDANGRPAENGKIVLLSIGMSNTTQEFSAFKRLADADPDKNPQVILVDGAQGGQDAERTKDPEAAFWRGVDQRVQMAAATNQQVQVVWLKQAIAGPREAFPADARRLQKDLEEIIQILQRRYPNLRLIYVSSRIYAGYATTPLNPEPYAYQSGFAVKWLIEDHIKKMIRDAAAQDKATQNKAVQEPWIGWGPYLWTNGTKGRNDGLKWERDDVGPDGTHPSPSGRRKVATLLLQFFKTDATTKAWFLK